MAKSYTTNTLIAALKRRSMIPKSQATFTDDDLVNYLNDEMESTITPMVMDVREEYFVEYQDFPVVNNVPAVFDVPERAVGERLRDVVLVSTEGLEESLTNLPRLSLEQISATGANGSHTHIGALYGFYMQGNQVKLFPSLGWGADTMRLYFFSRPGSLVLESGAAMITAINYNTNVVTVNNILSGWGTNVTVSTLKGVQPFNYIDDEAVIAGISGYDITFADVSELSVNDWICNPGESVFPQLPIEAHNLLLQAAKIVLLESLDDEKNIKLSQEKYTQMLTNFMKTITPRVDGQPKKIVSKNSVFRANRGWN